MDFRVKPDDCVINPSYQLVKKIDDFVQMLENKVFKEIMRDKTARVTFFESLRKYNGIGDKE